MSLKWGYALVLVPWLTELAESGRLPNSAQDLVTEITMTLLIAGLVFALSRERLLRTQMNDTDSLTGLYNRRRFQDDLTREVGRARRMKSKLTMGSFEIGGMPRNGDVASAMEPDALLYRLANLLRQSTRQDLDLCYRLAESEFAVLLPGTDASGSETVSGRVRRMSKEEPFALEHHGISLAIAMTELLEEESPDAFRKRAVAALRLRK